MATYAAHGWDKGSPRAWLSACFPLAPAGTLAVAFVTSPGSLGGSWRVFSKIWDAHNFWPSCGSSESLAALPTESESLFSCLQTDVSYQRVRTYEFFCWTDCPGGRLRVSGSAISVSSTRDSCLCLRNELKISKGNCE